MHRALRELTIVGVETSREFHIRVLEDPAFQRGDIDIQWLERSLSALVHAQPPSDIVYGAAVAAALLADRERGKRRAARRRTRRRARRSGVHSAHPRGCEAARREGLR